MIKGWQSAIALVIAALMAACATPAPREPGGIAGGAYKQWEHRSLHTEPATDRVQVEDAQGVAELQLVPFRTGVSAFTVERLARSAGCQPRRGAGLLAGEGPLEIYRVQCEDGRSLTAQCELRQCRLR